MCHEIKGMRNTRRRHVEALRNTQLKLSTTLCCSRKKWCGACCAAGGKIKLVSGFSIVPPRLTLVEGVGKVRIFWLAAEVTEPFLTPHHLTRLPLAATFALGALLIAAIAALAPAGVSLKTQELYLLVFLTRYLDLFLRFISFYNR